MNGFKASEILEIAMRIEENGQKLYRHAATLTGDSATKDVFAFLANEEAKHKTTFQGMLSKIEKYQPPESYPGEYFAYLRAYAEGIVFPPDRMEKELTNITDVESAVEFGVQREVESILYYLEVRNLVPEHQRAEIDRIADEERSHYLKLTDLKRGLQ